MLYPVISKLDIWPPLLWINPPHYFQLMIKCLCYIFFCIRISFYLWISSAIEHTVICTGHEVNMKSNNAKSLSECELLLRRTQFRKILQISVFPPNAVLFSSSQPYIWDSTLIHLHLQHLTNCHCSIKTSLRKQTLVKFVTLTPETGFLFLLNWSWIIMWRYYWWEWVIISLSAPWIICSGLMFNEMSPFFILPGLLSNLRGTWTSTMLILSLYSF